MRDIFWFIIFCCASVLLSAVTGSAQATPAPTATSQLKPERATSRLEPGSTIEAKKPPSLTTQDQYTFELRAGSAITLTLATKGAAMFAWVYDPLGISIANVYPQEPGWLSPPMFICAEKDGEYRITIDSARETEYVLAASVVRTIGDIDRRYCAAQNLYLDYAAGPVQGTARAYKEAKNPKSLPLLDQRISIYRELNDSAMIALSLRELADELINFGERERALPLSKEAQARFHELGRTVDECWVLIWNLSVDAINQRGAYQEGIQYLYDALDLSRANHYAKGEHMALGQLGTAYSLLGDRERAMDFYKLSISVPAPEPYVEARVRMARLIRGFTPEITTEGFPRGPATPDIASITSAEAEDAIAVYQQVLKIYRDMWEAAKENPAGVRLPMMRESDTLKEIGETFMQAGDLSKALAVLTEAEQMHPFNKRDEKIRLFRQGHFDILVDIAAVYIRKGDLAKAREYLDRAATLFSEMKQGLGSYKEAEGQVLTLLACYLLKTGDAGKALQLLNQALQINRAQGKRSAEASTLYEIANLEREQGNFGNAEARIREAIALAESIRTEILLQDLRASYFSTIKKYYEFYIDLLMQARKARPDAGLDDRSLEVTERSRSRSLLELLSLNNIELGEGVDRSLLGRDERAREGLRQAAYKQTTMLLDRASTKDDLERAEREVISATEAHEAIRSEIRSKSPKYAAITQALSLKAPEIQKLLDSGTVLLEYALGDKQSYLWCVTPDKITSFDLPGRAELEQIARRTRDLMIERNKHVLGETAKQEAARIALADRELPRQLKTLSEALLTPAADTLGNKRLLIVADGALSYLPFEALPEVGAIGASDTPLSAAHEVVMLPSASALARLREEAAQRKRGDKLVAIFADPVFDADDATRRAGPTSAARKGTRGKELKPKVQPGSLSASRDFELALRDTGVSMSQAGGLPRLDFSRREADAIFSFAARGSSIKNVDFDASKAQVFSAGLDKYQIVHFATHGLLDSQRPELSGVVLSLVDKTGARQDGFLRLQDIYNLKLNADLVVLSACNTALGKEIRGEGLIGLTRGFMYAGAPRVIASLWKVDDRITKDFMTVFYHKLLVEQMRPAAAFRAAQNDIRKRPGLNSPYYWAPFILQGEWR